jgi:pimeloyl-ACP methyl ester carboxylesterase
MRIDETYVYTGGRPFDITRPTAVFIHGAANDHSVWALQSRYFAHHGWNVLAPDLPGHGQSRGAPCSSVEAIAEHVAGLLAALGVRDAFVAGHSMGSLAALELAASRPERVSRLALIGTAVPMAVGDALLDAARSDEERARRMIVGWSFAPASQLANNQRVPGTWLPGVALALMRRQPRGVLANDLAACKAYANGLTAAQAIAVPALVVIGERDMMTPPKAAAQLVETLRDVRVERLPEAGHSMLSEAPDRLLESLWGFAKAS